MWKVTKKKRGWVGWMDVQVNGWMDHGRMSTDGDWWINQIDLVGWWIETKRDRDLLPLTFVLILMRSLLPRKIRNGMDMDNGRFSIFSLFHQLTPRRRLFYSRPTTSRDSNDVDSPAEHIQNYLPSRYTTKQTNQIHNQHFSLTTSLSFR